MTEFWRTTTRIDITIDIFWSNVEPILRELIDSGGGNGKPGHRWPVPEAGRCVMKKKNPCGLMLLGML
jgi:hypothetical protein